MDLRFTVAFITNFKCNKCGSYCVISGCYRCLHKYHTTNKYSLFLKPVELYRICG
jgi:hypothetical protein